MKLFQQTTCAFRKLLETRRLPFHLLSRSNQTRRTAQLTLRKRSLALAFGIVGIALLLAAPNSRSWLKAQAAGVAASPRAAMLTRAHAAGARLWRSMFASPLAGTISGTVFQDYNSNG